MGRHHLPFPSRLAIALLLSSLVLPARVDAEDNSGDSASAPPAISSTNGFPTEVTVKGHEKSSRITSVKPPLHIRVDPFASIRSSLKPDKSLLLAMSPLMDSWRRTHPEFLMDPRVIKPWSSALNEGSGIIFHVRRELKAALGRPVSNREASSYAWKITIANDQGRVFQKYGAPQDPPKESIWSGESATGRYVEAGKSYSPIYTFADSQGSPHTIVGKPIVFKGTIHQETDGRHIELNSTIIFGPRRTETQIQKPEGQALMRSAADLIKRFFPGYPLLIEVFAETSPLAHSQVEPIKKYLLKELMLPPQNLTTRAAEAPFSHQRVVIVILNP